MHHNSSAGAFCNTFVVHEASVYQQTHGMPMLKRFYCSSYMYLYKTWYTYV